MEQEAANVQKTQSFGRSFKMPGELFPKTTIRRYRKAGKESSG